MNGLVLRTFIKSLITHLSVYGLFASDVLNLSVRNMLCVFIALKCVIANLFL